MGSVQCGACSTGRSWQPGTGQRKCLTCPAGSIINTKRTVCSESGVLMLTPVLCSMALFSRCRPASMPCCLRTAAKRAVTRTIAQKRLGLLCSHEEELASPAAAAATDNKGPATAHDKTGRSAPSATQHTASAGAPSALVSTVHCWLCVGCACAYSSPAATIIIRLGYLCDTELHSPTSQKVLVFGLLNHACIATASTAPSTDCRTLVCWWTPRATSGEPTRTGCSLALQHAAGCGNRRRDAVPARLKHVSGRRGRLPLAEHRLLPEHRHPLLRAFSQQQRALLWNAADTKGHWRLAQL